MLLTGWPGLHWPAEWMEDGMAISPWTKDVTGVSLCILEEILVEDDGFRGPCPGSVLCGSHNSGSGGSGTAHDGLRGSGRLYYVDP